MNKLRLLRHQFDQEGFGEKLKALKKRLEESDPEILIIIGLFSLTVFAGLYFAFNMGDFL